MRQRFCLLDARWELDDKEFAPALALQFDDQAQVRRLLLFQARGQFGWRPPRFQQRDRAHALQRRRVRDVAPLYEIGAGGVEITQPEDLPVRDQEQPLVGAPLLQPQPACAVAQQGALDEEEEALVIEQEIRQRVLEALRHEPNEPFWLGVRSLWIAGMPLQHLGT